MENKTYQSLCAPSRKIRRRRIKQNEISLIYNSTRHHYDITLSSKTSELVRQLGLTKMDVRKDELTDEISIIISNEHGIVMSKSGGDNGANLSLCNKEAIVALYQILGLEKHKNHIVKISKNLSKRDGFLVFRIIPQVNVGQSELTLF